MIRQMSSRERLFVFVGVTVTLMFLLWFGLFAPYQAALNRLDSTVELRKRQLGQVQQIQQEYQVLQRDMSRLEARLDRTEDFAALAFVENMVGEVAGREQLAYMRPKPAVQEGPFSFEPLELKVERLNLQQVLRLLWEIERSRAPLRISDLQLRRRFDDASSLDLVMTVTTARRSG